MVLREDESSPLNGTTTTAGSYGATTLPEGDPEAQEIREQLDEQEQESLDHASSAQAVLERIRSASGANSVVLAGSSLAEAYLPILLYAAYLNDQDGVSGKTSSRERLRLEQQRIAVDSMLQDKVAAYLDGGMRRVREAVEGETETLRQVDTTEDPERGLTGLREGVLSPETDVEVEVEEMIWQRWRFGEKDLSVIDLLLPPYTTQPSSVLSHPLLVHSLQNAWRHGLPPSIEGLESRFGRVRNRLLSYITPRRSHMLSLGSHIILLLLTLLLALAPRRWIHPYKQQSRHPHYWEGIYIAWAYSSIFDASLVAPVPHRASHADSQGFHCRLRTVFLIPTTCVPILAYLDSEWAFSLLTFSILPLTLLLILPHSPSLALLHPGYVPLSTLLVHLAMRGLGSAKFLVPLCLAVFAIFAWALNGDMFRGFFATPHDDFDLITAPLVSLSQSQMMGHDALHALGGTDAQAKPTYDDIPVEPGLAPFETRLMLFITLLTLLFLSLAVTLVRILTPAYTPPVGSSNATQRPDPWVTEYGPAIAASARQRWAQAVRTDIVRKEIVAPLNFTVEGIFPVDEVLFVLEWLPPRWISARMRKWMKRMQGWRDTVWVFVMGPLCFPLYLVDRVVYGRDAWT